MLQNFDIVVVGNVGIDTNVYLEKAEIDFRVEANFTTNADYLGQAGGYGARGFASLGYRTAFIGYIGNDYHGEFIRRTFAKDGINTDGLFIDPAGTSRSINFIYPDGKRKNFYDGKSHMVLKPDLALCHQILKKTKLVHFNIPNWARYLLPMAKELNIPISVDLQDIVDPNDPYRQDFIQYADVIFFSNVNFDHPKIVMNTIENRYQGKIIISGMGQQGCAFQKDNQIHYYNPIDFGGPVVDTNGAGDGLAVGFLSQYFLEKQTLESALKAAQIVARFTCSQKATTDNLIKKEILTDILSKL
ncbi:MAG: carbohydrate kinase family protein [Candidatus Marinimicrobia bacterium]|nr:carbohydrate kinase family protein [Candidatus Neomarinimicrobiota bacterium]